MHSDAVFRTALNPGSAINCFQVAMTAQLSYDMLMQVSERVKSLLSSIETAHKGRNILLVSHGDTLSILWATATGLSLNEHRKHGLSTGELMPLHVGTASEPGHG